MGIVSVLWRRCWSPMLPAPRESDFLHRVEAQPHPRHAVRAALDATIGAMQAAPTPPGSPGERSPGSGSAPDPGPHWAAAVDGLCRRVGAAVAWLGLVMVLVGAWNAVGLFVGPRFGLRLTTNSLTELQWYLFSVLFLFAAPWALAENAHVRVDVLHARLHPRQRDTLELCGLVLLLCPFTAFVAATTWPVAWQSFLEREGSPDPGGLTRWPLKMGVPVAFALLTLQGLALAARRMAALGVRTDDDGEGSRA
jgi:TRAP-type mannitol/chloroaromatic compound transport system permease small subunit